MLKTVLPPSVIVVETTGDTPVDTLWPDETHDIASAPVERQLEFATVRHCAREGLQRLGLPPAAILRDRFGAPLWPSGVVGSMTHCRGFRAAAVAHAGDITALGIDAQPVKALPPGVFARISGPGEQELVTQLKTDEPGIVWDTLLFSAKESLYKAWYHLTGTGLGFLDVDFHLHTDGRLDFTFLRPVPDIVSSAQWQGGWSVDSGLVLTAIWATPSGS